MNPWKQEVQIILQSYYYEVVKCQKLELPARNQPRSIQLCSLNLAQLFFLFIMSFALQLKDLYSI